MFEFFVNLKKFKLTQMEYNNGGKLPGLIRLSLGNTYDIVVAVDYDEVKNRKKFCHKNIVF